jgi:outer membrane protein OmpA-like peptidoglycan-associated protein
MKKIFSLFIIFFQLVTVISVNAQYRFIPKIGVEGNYLFPLSEFSYENKGSFNYDNGLRTSLLGRVYARMDLLNYLDGEIGVGYGNYAANDFGNAVNNFTDKGYVNTQIIPVDFRLILSPYNVYLKTVNPYIYAGAGALNYNVKTFPNTVNNATTSLLKSKGWAGFFPYGIGANINLVDKLALDVHIGGAYTTTDNLNYYINGKAKDAYLSAGLGLMYRLGPVFPSKDVDSDGDGLSDWDEVNVYHTDPFNWDTDGDSLSDGDEVLKYHTDPLKVDTDGDGLSDYDEVMKYHTDPLKVDTDGDGLSDYDEVMKYHTDPLKVDTDGDGLSDYDEVMVYHTDPLNPDTDGDGLSDGDEVLKYHTDPLKWDTDGDGLSDGEEVLKYHTNPLKADTDGGGVPDGVEVKRGSNPLDPTDDFPWPKPIQVKKTIALEPIEFNSGKYNILPKFNESLMRTVKILNDNPEVNVEIQGHTDNMGSNALNMKLSLSRANAIKAWLVKKGINVKRFTIKGFGFEKPVGDNKTAEGRQRNRRVDFLITK